MNENFQTFGTVFNLSNTCVEYCELLTEADIRAEFSSNLETQVRCETSKNVTLELNTPSERIENFKRVTALNGVETSTPRSMLIFIFTHTFGSYQNCSSDHKVLRNLRQLNRGNKNAVTRGSCLNILSTATELTKLRPRTGVPLRPRG